MSNPNTIQGGRWDEFFRRKFNLKGGANTPELGAEILPTVPIPFGPEDRYLLQDKLCMGGMAATGTSGQFPRIVLEMPIGSNKIGIVEGMWLLSGTSQVQLNVATFFGRGVSSAQLLSTRDARWGPQTLSLPTMIMNGGSVAAKLSVATLRFGAGEERTYIPLDIVLWPPPGSGSFLVIEGFTPASTIIASFLWRETIVDPSADG